MRKLFISQPMAGKTHAQILAEREAALEMAHKLFGDFELIDSVFDLDAQSKNVGLHYLGRSLTLMAEADIVMFCPGWENARGCKIEHDCALAYGVGFICDKW